MARRRAKTTLRIYALTSSCIIFIVALTCSSGAPLALDNGMIRIEIEPRTFSVRFLGASGGKNFVEPAYLTPTELASGAWLEPGGIVSDILPVSPDNALLRRGPAEVIEQRDDYLLLLGPEHPESRWRIKKEFQLSRGAAALTYKLTVLSSLKEERSIRVRTTAQLIWNGALTLPREPGRLVLLRGAYPGISALLDVEEAIYTVPLIPRADRRRAVLSSPASGLVVSTDFGQWTRQMDLRSSIEASDSQGRYRLLALLDDPSLSYQVALETAQSGVNVGAPLVVVERWTIAPPQSKRSVQYDAADGAGELVP